MPEEIINTYWGTNNQLNTLHMSFRGLVIFVLALITLRVSGRRSFGVGTPLDNIVVILVGAILSRAVTGASPFLPVVTAAFLIACLHRLFSWCKVHYPAFGHVMEGKKIILYRDGRFIKNNMSRALVGEEDIMHAVRAVLLSEDLCEVDSIIMERNGELTVIRKNTREVLADK